MASTEEPKGVETPSGEPASTPLTPPHDETPPYSEAWSTPAPVETMPAEIAAAPASRAPAPSNGGKKPPKPPGPPDEHPDEEEGMARMSFLEHLEELRKRLLLAIGGVGVAFMFSLLFSDQLWAIVQKPAKAALTHLGVNPPDLALINPMDTFQIIWMKLPILSAVFISSPWIVYQGWAFIAPGLYKRERRWAAPFVLSSAGLFILGGFFAYFVAFRYGLEFLLGLGMPQGIHPVIDVSQYYDLFVDVMLGVGIIFEIPVLLFLLTLVHVASPAFLVRHSRYAILAIVILAAVITPTGDVFNLALFATPMIILFYIGIFASYILVLSRENRKFPWATFFKWLVIVMVVLVIAAILAARHYGYHFIAGWPPIVR